ncbi:hypothetical protein FQA39_LY03852 [Lamprigera yunnana]|nr:hypothetical protein FQA39_LY03852 [Lamprigera yunnana]
MEFDLSKENIQPLRGGRNASRLEVALQAQTSEEYHKELLIQKEKFEDLIRKYEGDDPLENWYQYICWVEQSYPKHGLEGNLVLLLEDCLTKFENYKAYLNDFRFCKLWIKYIDLQQNPLELYHMMHAKGICRGCADLYRAWAYYHEVVGDYRSADVVFQMGKRELAQPYDELIEAHQNMIYAVGQQVVSGVNEQRLIEQRQALTALRPYMAGKYGSERIVSNSGPGVLPSTSSCSRSNVIFSVYEQKEDLMKGAEAAPNSILSVAKRETVSKENTTKPGIWIVAPHLKNVAVHTEPQFAVHVDNEAEARGLRLPDNFNQITLEDSLDEWKPLICFPEDQDPARFTMYPKDKVYCSPGTEFSLEEIRATRYLPSVNVSSVETAQAVQSILGDDICIKRQELSQQEHLIYNSGGQGDGIQHLYIPEHHVEVLEQPVLQNNYYQPSTEQPYCLPQIHHEVVVPQDPLREIDDTINISRPEHKSLYLGHKTTEPLSTFNSPLNQQNKSNTTRDYGNNLSILWRSPENVSIGASFHQPPRHVSKFSIYEESHYPDTLQPKGSAMKSIPLKLLSDEDLAETGSRGGHDIAAAAQPDDEAKSIVIDDDESNSCLAEMISQPVARYSDLNSTCNTQLFNFNLNVMKVSTPQNKIVFSKAATSDEAPCRQLFSDNEVAQRMSPIIEETSKCYGSSLSSGASLKSSTFNNSKRDNMAIIAEESSTYHFNLAQNLKANAALRTSVLEVMECESGQNSPVTETPIQPIVKAPSDPFKPALLKQLLEKIGFPGRHSNGYVKINGSPRIGVRKEVTHIGDDRYLVNTRLGEGTYGQVYKATDLSTNQSVALKLQKPPNCWEYYICKELQVRLAKHPLKDCFMDIQLGYFSDHTSVFVSEFCPSGSLLDAVNSFKTKAGYPIKQSLCIYFCIEMLKIVSAMHQAKIIHADIKPDNFLVYLMSDTTLQLQLIDFGCSIDMTFFPPGTTFQRRITTKDFTCCEMQDGRPWNYHTDLFCVAATAHVLLFDKYMQVQKNGIHWSITQRFTRYMRQDLWNEFFSRLLNQQDGPANPDKLVEVMIEGLHRGGDELNMEMRKLVNILNNR